MINTHTSQLSLLEFVKSLQRCAVLCCQLVAEKQHVKHQESNQSICRSGAIHKSSTIDSNRNIGSNKSPFCLMSCLLCIFSLGCLRCRSSGRLGFGLDLGFGLCTPAQRTVNFGVGSTNIIESHLCRAQARIAEQVGTGNKQSNSTHAHKCLHLNGGTRQHLASP